MWNFTSGISWLLGTKLCSLQVCLTWWFCFFEWNVYLCWRQIMIKHLPMDTHNMYQPTACRLHQRKNTQVWGSETSPLPNHTVCIFIAYRIYSSRGQWNGRCTCIKLFQCNLREENSNIHWKKNWNKIDNKGEISFAFPFRHNVILLWLCSKK